MLEKVRENTCRISAPEHMSSVKQLYLCFVEQEEHMYSCWKRTQVLLLDTRTGILAHHGHMHSDSGGIHVLLFDKKKCTPVEQECKYSFSARTHAFLFAKDECILDGQGHMFAPPAKYARLIV